MMDDPKLDEILAEVGRDHRAVNPPERLEPILRVAAERRRNVSTIGRARIKWTWAALAALLIAVVALGTIWQSRMKLQTTNQQVRPVRVPQIEREAGALSNSGTEKKVAASVSKGVNRRSIYRRGQHAPAKEAATWSPLDEFVPLPMSEGLAPASDLSVVRVKVKGSDLQQYGFEAPADAAARVMLAEFVIGEDGLPRGIRIVR
ncbi:MAG: hypothetical protein JST28_14155 [Acidobacteria bacterium]|nr:hypothetical protein [Acidobacteriota bacterium]